MANPYADHDPGDEDAADHLHRLMISDPIAALCHLVAEAGLTLTLYGKPIGEQELKATATESALDRAIDAVERGRRSIPW